MNARNTIMALVTIVASAYGVNNIAAEHDLEGAQIVAYNDMEGEL